MSPEPSRGSRCACGCRKPAANRHHCVYAQHLSSTAQRHDRRNLIPLAFTCHMGHHSRAAVLALRVLPDSVFEFAVEVLGAPAAYEYLARYYGGDDPRLDALLGEAA